MLIRRSFFPFKGFAITHCQKFLKPAKSCIQSCKTVVKMCARYLATLGNKIIWVVVKSVSFTQTLY